MGGDIREQRTSAVFPGEALDGPRAEANKMSSTQCQRRRLK